MKTMYHLYSNGEMRDIYFMHERANGNNPAYVQFGVFIENLIRTDDVQESIRFWLFISAFVRQDAFSFASLIGVGEGRRRRYVRTPQVEEQVLGRVSEEAGRSVYTTDNR